MREERTGAGISSAEEKFPRLKGRERIGLIKRNAHGFLKVKGRGKEGGRSKSKFEMDSDQGDQQI